MKGVGWGERDCEGVKEEGQGRRNRGPGGRRERERGEY